MRPYTTGEVIRLLHVSRFWIANVVNNANRSTPHPLLRAHLARGMWDKEQVDYFIAHREELEGRRKEKTP